MAFNEGLKQKIDLLGALEARRRMEQASANDDMQRRLMQEQLKAAEWQNLKDREVPTMTVPSSGLTGMPTKKFLHEMPGYISGVDPTEVFRQWNQNFRQGMASGGGGHYGRGGGEELAPQGSPYSYEGPDHSKPVNIPIGPWPGTQPMDDAASNLGGGSMSGGGTYKEFSTSPTGKIGRIVDLMGNETVTGPAAAAEYQSGVAGAEDVKKILRDREAQPGKQAEAKAKTVNYAMKSIKSDPRWESLGSRGQKYIMDNIDAIVENNIKTRGTATINISDIFGDAVNSIAPGLVRQ